MTLWSREVCRHDRHRRQLGSHWLYLGLHPPLHPLPTALGTVVMVVRKEWRDPEVTSKDSTPTASLWGFNRNPRFTDEKEGTPSFGGWVQSESFEDPQRVRKLSDGQSDDPEGVFRGLRIPSRVSAHLTWVLQSEHRISGTVPPDVTRPRVHTRDTELRPHVSPGEYPSPKSTSGSWTERWSTAVGGHEVPEGILMF